MTDQDEMSLIIYYNSIRKNYIDDIKVLIENGCKNRAILSFKYDYLNFIINLMQILIILISATVTLMESIKTYYNTENEAIDITAILFTSFIGIIMTLYRFLKLENKKERTGNILESYNLIFNKLQKVKNTMKNMVIKGDNTEEWAIISNSYTNETLISYISIKESFDNNLSYKESLYYQNKYAKFLLREKFLENELNTIVNFNHMPHTQFNTNNCFGWRKFDYNKFIRLYDSKNTDKSLKKKAAQRTNQELYFKLLNSRNIEDYRDNFLKATSMPDGGIDRDRGTFDISRREISSPGIPGNVMSSCSMISPSRRSRNPRRLSYYQDEDSHRLKYVRPKKSTELEDGYSESEVETEPPSPTADDDPLPPDFPPPPDRPPPEPQFDTSTDTTSDTANVKVEITEPVEENKNSKRRKVQKLDNGLVIFEL